MRRFRRSGRRSVGSGVLMWCWLGGAWGCAGPGHDAQWLASQCSSACEAHLRAAAALESRHGGVAHDAAACARLREIGRRLEGAAGISGGSDRCRYELLDCDRLNALSLPGGNIYITRGLYERLGTEALLAGALAHELAHVAGGDGLRPCRTDAARLAREVQADARAVGYLAAAGFEPGAMLEVLAVVEGELQPGWSTARKERLEESLEK